MNNDKHTAALNAVLMIARERPIWRFGRVLRSLDTAEVLGKECVRMLSGEFSVKMNPLEAN